MWLALDAGGHAGHPHVISSTSGWVGGLVALGFPQARVPENLGEVAGLFLAWPWESPSIPLAVVPWSKGCRAGSESWGADTGPTSYGKGVI